MERKTVDKIVGVTGFTLAGLLWAGAFFTYQLDSPAHKQREVFQELKSAPRETHMPVRASAQPTNSYGSISIEGADTYSISPGSITAESERGLDVSQSGGKDGGRNILLV